MPYLEISIPCDLPQQADYESALEAVGALSVTFLDAYADTPEEQLILEPGVGETPLWEALTITALFEGETDPLVLLATLEQQHSHLDWGKTQFVVIQDQDWERVCLDQFKPMQFGQNTFIVPWNQPIPTEANTPNAAVVRLDPGLAFGSGTHPTTALCLQWLDQLAQQHQLQGQTVLDMGCGSGILALAALKLGALSAVAIDNDPQALIATHDNADRNGVASQISVFLPKQAPTARYPIVVANILASALEQLASHLAEYVECGGLIALSGILHGQEDALVAQYSEWFDALTTAQEGDWMRITGVRRSR